MANQKNEETLEAQITQLETLALHKPADVSIQNLLADLYLKKGLIEKSATAHRDALRLAISKKEFKIAFEILGKALFGNIFDIIAVKDILSVLRAPDLQDESNQFYGLIAQHRLTINKSVSYAAIKRMHQMDPANKTLLRLFREMEAPDETLEAAIPPVKAFADSTAETERSSLSSGAPPDPAPQRAPDTNILFKDKFLEIAKEKSSLEAIIMQQHDTIKDLERDKAGLSQSLRKLVDEQRKMKEKLLDYDILRNMEISDLKKKIESLIAEKKQAASEREALLQNLERDRKNIASIGPKKAGGQNEELQRLEELLALAHDDLRSRESVIETMRKQLAACSGGDTQQTHAASEDASSGREEVRQLLQSLEQVTREKAMTEETLRQETSAYHKEMAALKVDLEELTLSIEQKIQQIDELTDKVNQLNKQLGHRDSDLAEKIPDLLAKINQLSLAIDRKMEENSLFAKELADLNQKIADLNRELIQKDELLIGLSEEYREEATAFLARERAFEEKLSSLNTEKNTLAAELDAARTTVARHEQSSHEDVEELRQARQNLADAAQRLAEAENLLERQRGDSEAFRQESSRLQDALGSLQAELADKDSELGKLRQAHEEERTRLEQELASRVHGDPDHDGSSGQLREELDRYHALCADLHQQVSRLHVQLETESSGYRAGIASLRQTHDDELTALKARLASLSEELAGKEDILRQSNEALSREQERSAALAGSLSMLEGRQSEELAQQKVEWEALQLRFNSLTEQSRVMETETVSLRSHNEELLLALKALEEEKSSGQASTDALEQSIAQLRETGLGKDREIEALKQAVSQMRHVSERSDEELAAFRQKTEELARRLAVYEEESASLRASSSAMDQTITALREDLLAKEREIGALRQTPPPAESAPASPIEELASLEQHAEALASELREKERTLEALRQELDRSESALTRHADEHEQAVSRMGAELDTLRETLADRTARLAALADQSAADAGIISEMKARLSDSVKDSLLLADEKKDLISMLAEKDRIIAEANDAAGRWQTATDQLQQELVSFRSASEKQTRLLEALLAEKAALAAHLARVSSEKEQAQQDHAEEIRDLADQLRAAREQRAQPEDAPSHGEETQALIQEPVSQPDSPALEPEPRATGTEDVSFPRIQSTRPKPRLSMRTVFLFIVFLCLAGYYAAQQWLDISTEAPPQPAQSEAPRPVLTYDEIFARDTRAASSSALKAQATRITPELIAAARESAEAGQYDFSRYAYFKVTLNALKGGLAPSLVKDPSSSLALRTAQGFRSAVSAAAPRPPKTFFRRDIPTSTSFIAAFPLEGTVNVPMPFTLVLHAEGQELSFPWDASPDQPATVRQ